MTALQPQSPPKEGSTLPGQVAAAGARTPQLRDRLECVLLKAAAHRARKEGMGSGHPPHGTSTQHVGRSWCPRKDLIHQGTQSPPSELGAEMVPHH